MTVLYPLQAPGSVLFCGCSASEGLVRLEMNTPLPYVRSGLCAARSPLFRVDSDMVGFRNLFERSWIRVFAVTQIPRSKLVPRLILYSPPLHVRPPNHCNFLISLYYMTAYYNFVPFSINNSDFSVTKSLTKSIHLIVRSARRRRTSVKQAGAYKHL